jgi:hypothetical protein
MVAQCVVSHNDDITSFGVMYVGSLEGVDRIDRGDERGYYKKLGISVGSPTRIKNRANACEKCSR